MKQYLLLSIFLGLLFGGIHFHGFSQTYLAGDEALALGMSPTQAFQSFGAPSQLFIQSGPATWQDDIVFYFSDHSYLYWFNNRVWQVRFDRRHSDRVFGVLMGYSQEQVTTALGQPLFQEPGELVYPMVERGFPIRVRFLFELDRLVDIFLYRSDF